MKGLVLEIINSYEQRVSTIERLMTNAYETAADLDRHLSQTSKTRDKLMEELRETLSQNCSLRKKDFEALTRDVFNEIEKKQGEIEGLQELVRERLRVYLSRQKEMVGSLKTRVNGFTMDENGKSDLEALINNIKASCEDGEQIFALIRSFQFQSASFRREQETLNNTLQRLLARGKLLRLEDLRQLGAARAREERRTDSEVRREDVGRLLAHFRQHRLETSPSLQ